MFDTTIRRAKSTAETLNGRKVYRFHVKLTFDANPLGTLDHWLDATSRESYSEWLAYNGGDLLNHFKNSLLDAGISDPFELETTGPRGGRISRYAGFYTVIGSGLFRRNSQQLTLETSN